MQWIPACAGMTDKTISPELQIGNAMLPAELKEKLRTEINAFDHTREAAIDILTAIQEHYGYLSEAAVEEAAALLKMSPLEVDELATFYTFLYREPVGKYVIHVCDSLICWMEGEEN